MFTDAQLAALLEYLRRQGAKPGAAQDAAQTIGREAWAYTQHAYWSSDELVSQPDLAEQAAVGHRILRFSKLVRQLLEAIDAMSATDTDREWLQFGGEAVARLGSVSGRAQVTLSGPPKQQHKAIAAFLIARKFDQLCTTELCDRAEVSVAFEVHDDGTTNEASEKVKAARFILQTSAAKVIGSIKNDLLTLDLLCRATAQTLSRRDGRPGSGARSMFARCIWAYRQATNRWPLAGEAETGFSRDPLYKLILDLIPKEALGIDVAKWGLGVKTFRAALDDVKTEAGRRRHFIESEILFPEGG